uniref:GIY-YIG nuclease family protein n=1 Tax=Archaeoglobus fulgidus TaxID=2234 RepID=A0A7J2TJZ6_ARCFL
MTSYVLIMRNSEEREIEVGKLGRIAFKPGFYYYVGSAKRISRLLRHFGPKRKRWHIDYISDCFEILGAILFRSKECELAGKLNLEKIMRFGCSDCECESHLFYSKNLTIENLFA